MAPNSLPQVTNVFTEEKKVPPALQPTDRAAIARAILQDLHPNWHVPDLQTQWACEEVHRRLRKKHPQWSDQRTARKIAEILKLKRK